MRHYRLFEWLAVGEGLLPTKGDIRAKGTTMTSQIISAAGFVCGLILFLGGGITAVFVAMFISVLSPIVDRGLFAMFIGLVLLFISYILSEVGEQL